MTEAAPKRILLVDDDHLVRNAYRRILRSHGLEVATAASAVEALEMFRKGGFDLVVTDVAMPGMSGEELVRHLGGAVPVLVVTSMPLDELDGMFGPAVKAGGGAGGGRVSVHGKP